MKAITTKPTQMRLDSYVFEKLENRACGTLKIDGLAANVAVRVENANKKGLNSAQHKVTWEISAETCACFF